jgi:dephospho-CoA kinase
MEFLFDYIIAISVDDETRHQRIKIRDSENYENMIKLEKHQYDNDKKASLADFVIYSGNDDLNILNQLDNIISKILK